MNVEKPIEIDPFNLFNIEEDYLSLMKKARILDIAFQTYENAYYIIAKPVRDDRDAVVEEVSAGAEMIFGLEEGDFEGRLVSSFTPSFSEEQIKKAHSKLRNGEVVSGKKELLTKNDKRFLVRSTIYPFKNSIGEFRTLSVSIRIDELESVKRDFDYLNKYDPLTDLFNRTNFEKVIHQNFKAENLPISIVRMDINGLRNVNQRYGYKAGDKCLVQVAGIVKKHTPKGAFAGRWADDEFVIICPNSSREVVTRFGNKIQNKVANLDSPEKITIGSGIAFLEKWEKEKGRKAQIFNLLKRSEELMFFDKILSSSSEKHKIIKGFLDTLSTKSEETKDHAQRMVELSRIIGRRINLTQRELNKLALTAVLHDVGKAVIPSEILEKKGPLTDSEWGIIKEHPVKGAEIVSKSSDFKSISKYIRHHHEKWNGTGYPDGLKEEEIPIIPRIITIVDAYDVMTNGRVYQDPKSEKEALKELLDCSGEQFDPYLVDEFIQFKTS